MADQFTVKKSRTSGARVGLLRTAHGNIRTPFFMPIATKGAVKGITAEEVQGLGAEIILSNTYHLYLQPGVTLLKKFGGLHSFMNTKLPILTDSGGFQVFSLEGLRKIDSDGVTFQSHIDGSKHRLTPEKAIDIQVAIGSDIMMVLDFFPGYPATRSQTKESVELTTKWAERCLAHKKKLEKKNPKVKQQKLFAIIQGSTFKELREQSAKELTAMPFDGFAVGGLAVGEPAKKMYEVLDYTVPLLPENKPRYLMGVGYPDNIVAAVNRGIDMFDCVIPTREGRHGRLFVWKSSNQGSDISNRGKHSVIRYPISDLNFYDTMIITNAQFKNDTKPVDSACDCPLCSTYSRAYLYQLFKTKDYLGQRLASMHNLRFYMKLMESVRGGRHLE